MNKGDRQINRPLKNTLARKRITTIEDLLSQDDINEVYNIISHDRPRMTSLIAIYEDKQGNICWQLPQGMLLSKAIYLLEQTKFFLLSPGDGE